MNIGVEPVIASISLRSGRPRALCFAARLARADLPLFISSPAAAANRFAGTQGDVILDARDESLIGVNVHQLQVPEEARRAGEMDVIVVESGRDERALQIDQSRVSRPSAPTLLRSRRL